MNPLENMKTMKLYIKKLILNSSKVKTCKRNKRTKCLKKCFEIIDGKKVEIFSDNPKFVELCEEEIFEVKAGFLTE